MKNKSINNMLLLNLRAENYNFAVLLFVVCMHDFALGAFLKLTKTQCHFTINYVLDEDRMRMSGA